MTDDGWTEVYLRDYFLRNNLQSDQASEYFRKKVIPWCHGNLRLDWWKPDGVTRYSFRINFKDPEDALHFKLIFG